MKILYNISTYLTYFSLILIFTGALGWIWDEKYFENLFFYSLISLIILIFATKILNGKMKNKNDKHI